jgi:molecular chaperone GrpE
VRTHQLPTEGCKNLHYHDLNDLRPGETMAEEQNNPADTKPVNAREQESTLEFPSAEEIDAIAGDAADQPVDATTELTEKLAEAERQVLLAHAELDNFRRRNLRETQDKIKYAAGGLMTDILEAVDNLGRAVESYENDKNGDGLHDGVKLVTQQITTILEKHNCKKIASTGEAFDPNLHQALQMQPSDEFEANTVMQDLRPGFQLHDRVLRPSQVFVSTGSEKK